MTPEERIDQLLRIYLEDGYIAFSEALSEFAESNPGECVETVAAFCNLEGNEKFRATVVATFQHVFEKILTNDGFAGLERLVRIARKNGMDDEADKIESYWMPSRH